MVGVVEAARRVRRLVGMIETGTGTGIGLAIERGIDIQGMIGLERGVDEVTIVGHVVESEIMRTGEVVGLTIMIREDMRMIAEVRARRTSARNVDGTIDREGCSMWSSWSHWMRS